MTNVINFTGETILPCDANRSLQAAKDWGMEQCVIIGMKPDGTPMYGGNTSDAGDILIMLEITKKFILENMQKA